MSGRLWFIAEEDTPIAVFDSKRQAVEEYRSYQNEDDESEYRLYSLPFEEFEHDPDEHEEEYNLAMDEGLL